MDIGHVKNTGVVFSGVYLPPGKGNDRYNGKSKERAEHLQKEFINHGQQAITFPISLSTDSLAHRNEEKQTYLVITNEDIPIANAATIQKTLYQKLVIEYQQMVKNLSRKPDEVPDTLLQKQLNICQALDELHRLNNVIQQKCPELNRLVMEAKTSKKSR